MTGDVPRKLFKEKMHFILWISGGYHKLYHTNKGGDTNSNSAALNYSILFTVAVKFPTFQTIKRLHKLWQQMTVDTDFYL